MTTGALIAAHVANAAAAKSRLKALDVFRIQGATAPERARPLGELGLSSGDRAFAGLFASGVIRGVDSRGRATIPGDAVSRTVAYYLDESAYVAQRDRMNTGQHLRGALIAVMILLAVIAVLLGTLVVQRS